MAAHARPSDGGVHRCPDTASSAPWPRRWKILDERWTLLVVRELLLGSRHFNELRRGVPKMSPTLLSKRLQVADPRGHRRAHRGRRSHRLLADAVRPGAGRRRRRARLLGHPLDRRTRRGGSRPAPADVGHPPHHPDRRVAAVAHDGGVPARRGDVPRRRGGGWWSPTAQPTSATSTPGYEIAGTVETSLLTLTRIWRGDVGWSHACSTAAWRCPDRPTCAASSRRGSGRATRRPCRDPSLSDSDSVATPGTRGRVARR